MSTPVETVVASMEARVKALETKAESWFSKNWPHLITYAGLIAPWIIKHL